MASLNRVILIGRLTRDPELRYTPGGSAVANFGIAVDRRPGPQGEREADFVNIVTWNKVAESCANHVTKGRLVAVEGRLQIRAYQTQDGQRRQVAEVIANNVQFLDWPREAQAKPGEAAPKESAKPKRETEEEISLDDSGFAELGGEEVSETKGD